MKRAKLILSILTLQLLSLTLHAQDTNTDSEKGSLNSGTIQSQFDHLYKISPKWRDPNKGTLFKSIKVNNLFKFRDNVFDSLKVAKSKFVDANAVIAKQKTEIETLKTDLGSTNENLASVTEEKDSIKFLGMPMSKTGYNTLLWSIIGALAVLLAVFIGKFKRSNSITIQANKDKAEIEEEYEGHRQRSLEREQKLRRELQDEINKQKYAQQDGKKGSK